MESRNERQTSDVLKGECRMLLHHSSQGLFRGGLSFTKSCPCSVSIGQQQRPIGLRNMDVWSMDAVCTARPVECTANSGRSRAMALFKLYCTVEQTLDMGHEAERMATIHSFCGTRNRYTTVRVSEHHTASPTRIHTARPRHKPLYVEQMHAGSISIEAAERQPCI